MHAVRIVPQDAEILCGGLQRGKAADRFVGICNAERIGVFGDAPYSLDRGVGGNQPLHFVHIRAGIRHRDKNQFEPEILGHGKMPVVPGGRA